MDSGNALFTIQNRVALHEAGHAVVGWIMKLQCDPTAFDCIFQIFHHYLDGGLRGACHFEPGRATNIRPPARMTRNINEAVTDLAINMAGCTTYSAYLDPNGDPEYPLSDVIRLLGRIENDYVIGVDHDLRYFGDIARFDLDISIADLSVFAAQFQSNLISLLQLDTVRQSIEILTKSLLNLTPAILRLDINEISEIESIVIPIISSGGVAENVNQLVAFCQSTSSLSSRS